MTPHQYKSARRTLGWSYPELAEAIGKSERECYRYAAGAVEIPETVGKFIRRLVQDKLTLSERKFEEIVARTLIIHMIKLSDVIAAWIFVAILWVAIITYILQH